MWKWEVQSYVWAESEADDIPVKVNDHAQDACRYFVQTMNIIKKKEKFIPTLYPHY